MKKTLVFGATPNPERYSYKAVMRLKEKGYEVVAVGIRKGVIEGLEILPVDGTYEDVDTVSLYVNPEVQNSYCDYLLSLNPRRIIFNPGTENVELATLALSKGIEVENACTLVLLSIGEY